MQGHKTIFLCENSTDGIFTGIYDAWDSRLGHENIKLELEENMNYELFAEYRKTSADSQKAEKVANTLRRRLGMEDYSCIYQATLSKEREKANCLYHTIVAGLTGKRRGPVMQNLQNPYICRVFELSRTTGNEAHRYLQFLRFQELKSGILFAQIRTENFILPLIGDHFADRFPEEHFLIYDNTCGMFLLHEAHKQWCLIEGETLDREKTGEISEKEEQIQRLFKGFCHSVAIQERRNLKLQQQFLPLKFRAFMPEMISK